MRTFPTIVFRPLVLSVALGVATFVGNDLEAGQNGVERATHQGDAAVNRVSESRTALVLPPNLEFSEGLRPTLVRMWQSSPTFRRQCARLAETPDLTIVMLVGRLPEHWKSKASALTRIEGHAGQPMRAEVWLGLTDLEMHIAHEVEHILERVDGVHVEVMNALAIEGVTRYGDTFETARARETGRAVAREVMTGQALASRRF